MEYRIKMRSVLTAEVNVPTIAARMEKEMEMKLMSTVEEVAQCTVALTEYKTHVKRE